METDAAENPESALTRRWRPPISGKLLVALVATAAIAVPALVVGTGEPTNDSGPRAAIQSAPDIQTPITAAFYYPWYPEAWGQGLTFPNSKYQPSLGYYRSDDRDIVRAHVRAMKHAGIQAGIVSWWGKGTPSDKRIELLLSVGNEEGFQWALYYEAEGEGAPGARQISRELGDITARYTASPSYLHIKGRPVIFAYSDARDDCGMARRWKEGNAQADLHVVLRVFAGYRACAEQPHGWHQYAPAAPADAQLPFSYTISPGFDKVQEERARLPRDLARWCRNIREMKASGAAFQLITTFNEWPEGTSTESGGDWAGTAPYGDYIEALHQYAAPPAPDGTRAERPGPCAASPAA